MGKTQSGRCALCCQPKELQLSHIVPHLVGRKLIKTSPGNIRSTAEPNLPIQDIFKEYLLCSECEERFSAKETWFANKVFNPYIDKKEKLFCYDERLTYFIVSVSWRTLYIDLEKYSQDPLFDRDVLMTLFRAEQTMRDYLLGKRNDLEGIQNHLFFMDRIQSVSGVDPSLFPNVILHRSITSGSNYFGKTLYTVSNLMGILIVTFYSMDSSEIWVNTKVELGNGIIKAEGQQMTSVIGNEIQFWMEQGATAQEALSDKQRKKIEEKLYALGDDILKYPIFQDLFDDFDLEK